MRILFLSTYLAQEPLGVMHLSTALREAGHATRMLFLPDPAFPAKLRAFDPDVACYSFTTGVHTAVDGLNRLVKKIAPRPWSSASTGGGSCGSRGWRAARCGSGSRPRS